MLSGKFVSLEPLHISHYDDLAKIAQEEEIWTYTSYSASSKKNFDAWFEKALAENAYAVRRHQDKKIVGSTRLYDIRVDHKRATIGYTWYGKDARGTHVNPECKLLLLAYAFEKLDLNRVEFAIDSRNHVSQAAVKKLGATQEGVLRQHMITKDSYVRDTIIFSIIKPEWPLIKNNLLLRLR